MTDELKDRDTMRRDFEREVYKREDESSAGENTVLLVTTPDESPRTAGPDRDPNAWALPVGEKINMVYLDLAEANQRISELENAIRLQAEDEQRDHQVKVELIQQLAEANGEILIERQRADNNAGEAIRYNSERKAAADQLVESRIAQMFEWTKERLLDIFEKLMYPIPPSNIVAVDWYAGCTATRNKLYGEIRTLQPEPEQGEKL